MRRTLGVLMAAVALALSVSAGADPTAEELAAARKLFEDGKALEGNSDWAGALEKFKKVAEVKATPQVRFHVALCEENLGQMVAAINDYELAISDAKQIGANAPDVLKNAPPRAESLRGRVPSIHLEINGKVIYSRVLIDKAPVAAALFGTDIPVDPGVHVIEVETEEKIIKHRQVTLAEKEKVEVELFVHDKEKPAVEPSTTPSSTALPIVPPPIGPNRTPVYIAAGVGGAALLAAGVFFVLRTVAIQRISDSCTGPNNDLCDPNAKPILQDAETFTTATGISLGVAGAGLVTAGVLYFVIKPKKPVDDPAAKKPAVSFEPSPLGIGLRF